jgi:hypothetical protein
MGQAKIAGLVNRLFIAFAIATSLSAANQISYANTSPGVPYIGSRACAGCHQKMYQDYIRTAMGRSMASAADIARLGNVPAAASIFSEKLNRHFEVSRRDSELCQTEYELDSGGREIFRTTFKLEYAIGSGVNGYTYIVRRGNHLFQAPLSYYSRRHDWSLSPGYELADVGFNRPIAAGCIVCHSGRPQPIRDRAGLFRDPPFQELAIGCENCHGPGALHAAGHAKGEASSNGSDRTIVNPARLAARLAEDICMNCHQGSETRVLRPGKDYSDFRPGTPLRDTIALLRVPLERDAGGASDLLEHHFSMQMSKCYRAGGERLSCLTCHRIHAMPQPSEAAAYYRSRCLTCHTDASCRAPATSRQMRDDDCVTCHMPKRDVQVIAHSALTNHRIITRTSEPLPEEAFRQGSPGVPGLVYVNGPPQTSAMELPLVMLLQAYGELLGTHAGYQSRYSETLDDLSKTAPDQPLVQAALGRKMLQGAPNLNPEAIQHLRRAIELGFTAPAVFEDLVELTARAGHMEEAIQTLQRGIELDPYTPVFYKSLALLYIRLKRYEDAKKTMARYVELFPEDDFMRGLLLKAR